MSCVITEKLAGGRSNIKTQLQVIWSPLRGDMREENTEKLPRRVDRIPGGNQQQKQDMEQRCLRE